MASPTEEIKDRIDIVEFIKGYLELKHAGKNWKALCPFHQEKTPSFIVSPDRQTWHCFGCGDGGDIFKFLMRHEGVEFYEALRILADRAGVELKRISPDDQRQFGVLYDINAAAKDFFMEMLASSEKEKTYLKERGLSEETIKTFEIGFAPNEFELLTLRLVNNGFRVEDLVRAGVSFKSERGQYLDRFRGRIMFPIHNHFGKIAGFSGRIIPELQKDEVAKYMNTPDTPVFTKSRILYGFWETKRGIRDAGEALLVEGQMDFLMAWQDGVKNSVATSGTALTNEHLRALRRVAGKLVVAFDSDDAGQAAAERSIDLAGANDFTVFLMSLGEFEDPAEAARRSPGFLKQAVLGASPAMEYYFERYLSEKNLGEIQAKKQAVRTVLSKIAALGSAVERGHWIRELSHRARVSESELLEELQAFEGKSVEGKKPESSEQAAAQGRHETVAQRILSIMSSNPQLSEYVEPFAEFFPERYRKVYEAMRSGGKDVPQDARALFDMIDMQAGLFADDASGEGAKIEIEVLLRELAVEHLKLELLAARERIRKAEDAGDEDSVEKALIEFDDTSRKMQDIRNAEAKKTPKEGEEK